MAVSDEQRQVVRDYAELVSEAYNAALQQADDRDVALLVANSVAQMTVPPTIQEYARVLATKPTIQTAPRLRA